MNVISTSLEGVLVLEPKVFHDGRGFFTETYNAERYAEAGIAVDFVQDNHSRSSHGTLRGLHAQTNRPQDKLLRVSQGAIFDVAVDIRRGSPTFGEWFGVELSAENFKQIFVPIGFAHGFCVLSDFAEVQYKCSDLYDPSGELRLRWDDPEIAVRWPISDPVLSDKDAAALPLSELMDSLPEFGEPSK